MPTQINMLPLGGAGRVRVELTIDDARMAQSLNLGYGAALEAAFIFAHPFEVPPELLKSDGATTRIKTLVDIRKDLANAAGGASRQLEDQWRQLVKNASTASIKLADDGKFLNALIFPAGTASASARASFNLEACLLETGVVFKGFVELAGDFAASVGAATATVHLACRVSIDAALPEPSFAIRLPALGIAMPDCAFPKFTWPPDLTVSMPTFGFALPALPGIPLQLAHGAATLAIKYVAATGALDVTANVPDILVTAFNAKPVALGTLSFSLQDGALTVAPLTATLSPITWTAQPAFALPAPLDQLKLEIGAGTLLLAVDVTANPIEWFGYLTTEVGIYPSNQPQKQILLGLQLPVIGSAFVDSVNIDGLKRDRGLQLIKPTAADLVGALITTWPSVGSMGLRLQMPSMNLPSADGLVDVLSAILAAICKGVTGLARVVQAVLEAILQLLQRAAKALGKLEVLLVLDLKTAQLQQIVISLHHGGSAGPFSLNAAGFELSVPDPAADLALLLDLRDGALDAYAVVTLDTGTEPLMKLATDLWFASSELERPAGQITGPQAPTEQKKLINIEARSTQVGQRLSLVPLGMRQGQATFLRALSAPLPEIGATSISFDGYQLVPVQEQVTVTATFPSGSELKRLLPFLASPAGDTGGSGSAQWLKQYIEIEKFENNTVTLKEGKFDAKMGVVLHLMGSDVKSDLLLQLDASKMTAAISGGLIKISLPENEANPFAILGMKVSFSKDGLGITKDVFYLDMRSSDTRMYLADGIDAMLEFSQLGKDASGRPLTFKIGKFVVHGGGLDLDAGLAQPYRLKLNGLETDFTFKEAAIKIRSGRAESFRLEAKGKLPPALLGDVDVGLRLEFGQKDGGGLALLDGMLELENKGKPIRSEQTQFVLTLEHLGVRVFEEGGGLHFCAFITGSAAFKPTVSEMAEGMLKNLGGVELRFTDCPLSGASDVISRALEKLNLSFVVALDKPMRANLFDLFEFEVRSIGFEPRCNMFDDRPAALVIGGQVKFAAVGDVVRAECDFHRLYIAPGLGTLVPRLRCEGLGLALKLGGALEIEGKVVAVDGRMPPNVLLSTKPDVSLKANGFMGQGRIAIQGWPPFAASFGFVEIEDADGSNRRRAWFVYLEAQRLSYQFQLGPIPFYLREAGLGMGYYFTYVGIKAIDAPGDLPLKIKQLDTIAATAQEPAKIETWDIDGTAGPTVVARVMFSMSSASSPVETLVWKESEESMLPNLLLLNAVLAMRNSTFMMTANAWLGYSYYDWDKGRQIGPNKLVGKQAMTGYIIFSGARSEFMARLVSNPGAEVGPRLALPDAFKNALREVQYDATLYMRPGLLHFELGWPNRIRWSKSIGGANLNVAGGAIFRVHDGALLAGLNLEGTLTFELAGRLDAGVVGVAVQASVYAALAARIIGYLDSQNVSNSLYYSLFSLQVRVEFRLSAWLEIDAWLCKITIRISFAMSLQIDVMSELAITGGGSVGARMRATIAVSVFGRSLGLSVGLGMNPGLVDSSAARVGRFMNLGLVQDTPSAVMPVAQQDNANEEAARVGKDRREAQQQAAAANQDGSDLANVPQDEPPPAGFGDSAQAPVEAIKATDFQAVLSYPKVMPELDQPPAATLQPSDWVYLTFLPLDVEAEKSSFYSSPPISKLVAWDHCIEFEGNLPEFDYYAFDPTLPRSWKPHTFKLGPIKTSVDWTAKLPYDQRNGDGDVAPRDEKGQADLTSLFFAAFRTTADKPSKVDADHPYMEPVAKPPLDPGNNAAPQSNDQQRFLRQETGYLGAIKQAPADRRCHEARDFLLHKFASDLFELTVDGVVPADAHVVRLGLTLLVPVKVVDALLASQGASVKVRKRVDLLPPADQPLSEVCKVFNPPSLRFSVKRHKFIDPGVVLEEKVAKLKWKLHWESAVGESSAEDLVKHYRIVRTLTVEGRSYTSAPITIVCAKEEYWGTDANGVPQRQLHHSPYRYTDEFEDLPSALRTSVLNPAADIRIRYSVTPVCVSDTDGVVCSNFIAVRQGVEKLPRLKEKESVATLELDPREAQQAGVGQNKVQSCRLLLSIMAQAPEAGTAGAERPSSDKFYWRILARSEAILPAGDYGADAQTQQSLATGLGMGLVQLPGDQVFDIWSKDEQCFPPLIKDNGKERPMTLEELAKRSDLADLADLRKLQQLLQDVAEPRAWTLLGQSVVKRKRGDKELVVASSPLVPLQLAVQLVPIETGLPRFLTQVQALELVRHPFASEAQVLSPVAGDDLYVLAGRAALPEPLPKKEGASGLELAIASSLNLHPEFAAVSRLNWNLRPHGVSGPDARKFSLLSGFEVYALDLDTSLDPRQAASWTSAKRQTTVRLLSADRATLVPEEIGEPSNWKMRYPSQAARRAAGGTWYSDAESYIKWPASPIRKHALLEPPSELIKALLSRGAPDVIELRMRRPANPAETQARSLALSMERDWNGGWQFINEEEWAQLKRPEQPDNAASGLRAALRALLAGPAGADVGADWSFSDRSDWVLEQRPVWEKGGHREIGPIESVPMYFERDPHPMLATLLARMRRVASKDEKGAEERLLELDRRAAPVVKAQNLGEFLAATDEVADPYGWAALDRLGLGVTVRLFDTYANRFVDPQQLRSQLEKALVATKLLYPDPDNHLFVEYLLQPGAMTQRVDFTQWPDAAGNYTLGGHDVPVDSLALAMVRLSMRPVIKKTLSYRVFEKKTGGDAISGEAPVDVVLLPSGLQSPLGKRTIAEMLAQPGGEPPQYIVTRGEALVPDMQQDAKPGTDSRSDLPDAFGRFLPWPEWEKLEAWDRGGAQNLGQSWARFWLALRNAMRLGSDPESASNLASLKKQWLRWNRRFFEFAADPAVGDTQYALGAIEQTEPVQAAADVRGQL